MYISSIKIENYKSFADSDEVSLSPSFNVVVGKNNSGKTAFLEALTSRFGDKPFRDQQTVPYPQAEMLRQASFFKIGLALSKEELFRVIRKGGREVFIPIDRDADIKQQQDAFEQSLSDSNKFYFTFRNGSCIEAYYEPHANLKGATFYTRLLADNNSSTLQRPDGFSSTGGNQQQSFAYKIAGLVSPRIYMFNAERLSLSRWGIASEQNLEPTARNLARVLHYLSSSNSARFEKFNALVHRVLEDIFWVNAPPSTSNGNEAEIMIWPLDYRTERSDLAIPLTECGTGIGQVLAMLYVVVNSDEPKTILIDEPNSFLHPGAVRRLIEIFRREYPQHQYVISTHSSSIISSADPDGIFLIYKQDGVSNVRQIDSNQAGQMQSLLADVGVRLSDVFGADNILWVEGRTEEECFPIIWSRLLDRPIGTTSIKGVRTTDGFKKKSTVKEITDIYTRLSTGSALLPPAVGFIFDREGITPEKVADLEHEGKGKVKFLPRRMFENYLLNPKAIVHVLQTQSFSSIDVNETVIEKWLAANGRNREFVASQLSTSDELWLRNVDGANLLAALFAEFANGELPYDKVYFGKLLTEWICLNSPESFSDIVNILAELSVVGVE
jgi:ABC-type cobalamin/Fe3+-siderophores transport system ATPase subunit